MKNHLTDEENFFYMTFALLFWHLLAENLLGFNNTKILTFVKFGIVITLAMLRLPSKPFIELLLHPL